jgi:hypothetical protein
MGEKSKALAPQAKATEPKGSPQVVGLKPFHGDPNPLLGLQHTIGNRAMLQLLRSGAIQAKLRISQPEDADEIEADRVAERIVSSSSGSVLHRKCSCAGGTSCPECEQADQGVVHRSVATPLSSSELLLHRSPADQPANPPGAAQPTSPRGPSTRPLIVEDDAKAITPHQMRKSQFIALLRADACGTADAVLLSVGHTTKSCPYIEKWFSFYEKQSSQHIERALRKYAPEIATARSAQEAIHLVLKRIQGVAITWAKTGKIEGLPGDLAAQLPGQGGFLGAVHNFASSGVGGAILGFIGGKSEKEDSGSSSVLRKTSNGESAPTHEAAAVKAELGAGHALDPRVQSRMSASFGQSFSGVRVHTDARAAALSSDLNARAFTIGNDVAFASGEYQPGSLIGDALIAHELAHVVQQGAGHDLAVPVQREANDQGKLEEEADNSAVGAVLSAWTGAKKGVVENLKGSGPRLKAGLRLQRCAATTPKVPAGVELGDFWEPEALVKILVASGDRAVIEAIGSRGFTIARFTQAFDTFRFNDGNIRELPVPGLQGNTNRPEKKIRLLETLSNQEAVTALFHEVGHLTSGVAGHLEQEIAVRIQTEKFLIREGWPPYEPSYRNPDGTVNEQAIRDDIMGSDHYNPQNRSFISRRWVGEEVIPASRWKLP